MVQRNQSVVVAFAGDTDQADVICAALQGHGVDAYVVDANISRTLWHVALAIHPEGVRIAVPAGQADDARQLLQELGHSDVQAEPDLSDEQEPDDEPGPDSPAEEGDDDAPDHEEEPQAPTAEGSAKRAAIAGLFSLLFPPFVLVSLYQFIKALTLPQSGRPQPSRYFLHRVFALSIIFLWTVLVFLMGR